MAKILKKINEYVIYDTPNLDTECDKNYKSGCISIDKRTKTYWINGDLPIAVQLKMAKIAESRGLNFYYNNGSFEKALEGFK